MTGLAVVCALYGVAFLTVALVRTIAAARHRAFDPAWAGWVFVALLAAVIVFVLGAVAVVLTGGTSLE